MQSVRACKLGLVVVDSFPEQSMVLLTDSLRCCREKVHVPFNKSYITLEGAGMHKSIIEWDDNEERTLSTATTASVTLDADYFIARNISFKVPCHVDLLCSIP